MILNPVICPICQKQSSILPVAEIYFALLENEWDNVKLSSLSSPQKKELFKLLDPPSVNRRPIWHILTPDVLFGALFLILLFSALYGYFDENITLMNGIFILSLLSLLYFLLRKRIISSYIKKAKEQQEINAALILYANEWSDSWYCFSDQIIFNPVTQRSSSLKDFHAHMHTHVKLEV